MPADVNIASAIREQLEDKFNQLNLSIQTSSYQEYLNARKVGFRHVRIWSYVFYNDEDGRRIRVDVLDGAVYRPGCGGSNREMTAIAKQVTL